MLTIYLQQQQQNQQAGAQRQQQEQQQQQQPPYGSSQADYDGDSSMYDYDGDNRRPRSRGSKHGLETGGTYGGGGYQGQYNSPNPHSDYVQGDDDEDDDMW